MDHAEAPLRPIVQKLHFGPHSISLCSVDDAVDRILRVVDASPAHCKQVMASGFHGMWSVVSDPEVSRALSAVDLWIPDGIAPVWLARLLGARGVDRAPGPKVFAEVLAAAAHRPRPVRHYLLGDTPETLERLAKRIESKYPNNTVVGKYSPPFSPRVERAHQQKLDEINRSKADILWVGLGTPKQDLWIACNKPHLEIPIAVAVGAAFRFEIGAVDRAPDWIGRLGLEWAFRFSREPKKLWKRVLLEGTRFVWWSGRALFNREIRLEREATRS